GSGGDPCPGHPRMIAAHLRASPLQRLGDSVKRAQSRDLPSRDLRIDFFRGLALWMIFTDHIAGNFFARFTYQKLGFSDAAEIFIFLSGLSCAIAYGRILARDGYQAAQRRTLRRAWQIYIGYVCATAGSFLFALALQRWLPTRALEAYGLMP